MDTKPANLGEVIENNLGGYKLMFVFSLELSHGLAGYFPAYIKGMEPKRIVTCINLDLLHEVWKLLPPSPSKICSELSYVNTAEKIAFQLPNLRYHSLNDPKPEPFIDTEEFDQLIKKEEPFKWAPGLIGGSTFSQEWFFENIANAIKKEKERYVEVIS